MSSHATYAYDSRAHWIHASGDGVCAGRHAWRWRQACAWLAALAVGLWGQPARSEPVEARLSLRKGSEVQVAVLHDGFHVGLLLEHVEARVLAEMLSPLHADDVSILPVGKDRVIATLRFDQPVASARASMVHLQSARKVPVPATPLDANVAVGASSAASATLASATQAGAEGNTATTAMVPRAKSRRPSDRLLVDIHVALTSPHQALMAHVMHSRLPLPETLAHHRLWDAEQILMEGRLAEAQLMFEGLNKTGPLAGWAILRQGDLAAANGMDQRACQFYDQAQRISEVRVPSTLAGLRSRVLRCKEAPVVDYVGMLSRVGRDDIVGRNLAKEAQWALYYERELSVLDTVVGLPDAPRGRTLPKSLYDAVAARRLRLRDPMQRILADMRTPILPGQQEAYDLQLALGQAWCALDVPEQWQPPRQGADSWVHASAKARAQITRAVKTCQGLDHPDFATAISRAALPDVVRDMHGVEQRVAVALRAVGAGKKARGPSRAPKAAAPSPP